MTVGEVMTRAVVAVGLDDTVAHVRALFERNGFHHLLVTEHGALLGVLSDRDLLRNLSPFAGHDMTERPQDRALLNRRVHQIMTRRPVAVAPETPVEEAARTMLQRRVSCLPVVSGAGSPVGILSWKDLLGALTQGAKAAAPE